ncbi:cytochrome P450 [Nitrospirillum sp. BR 11163]|uniref:cytochrome P450 n=1 Tax=Nitrospirillum sp. BR 11163 TaxID=3104323 RepID=UPI002AFE6394|nr:cytochrome P450 [Nitrospirillum sp. BR 11163]MEA1674908.1 cytochrome P450 [Nitrospirillum sp. BR 11163]
MSLITRLRRVLLGDLPDFAADPIGFVERHGIGADAPVALRLGPKPAFLISHPAGFQRVLVENREAYGKGAEQARLRPLFGDGLVTANGPRWEAARHAAKAAFSQSRLNHGLELALCVLAQEAGRLARMSGAEVDLHGLMGRLTMRMVVAALFHERLENEAAADAIYQAGCVAHRHLSLSMWRLVDLDMHLPTREGRAFRGAIAEMERQIAGFAQAPKGFLAALHPLVEAYGPAVMRDEAITALVAGFETTATAGCWLAYALAQRPDLAAWLRQEIEEKLPADGELRPGLLRDLPRTRAMVQEVLRLYPSAWWFARTALTDDTVSGVAIPKGASILLCPWTLHRQPDQWADPLDLEPARFLDGAPQDKFAYVPFGAGPRTCIGAQLATAELTALAAMLVTAFDIEALSGPLAAQMPEGGITLGAPRAGMKVRLSVREPLRKVA